ncbi:MAG: NAD-dependent epimerase/dehydratase family protein [Vicingaceae bacterium]
MKILVLGSSGFIGRNTTKAFSQKNQVFAIDRLNQPESNGSLRPAFDLERNKSLLLLNNFDVLINCAGSGHVSNSFTDPFNDFQSNTALVAGLLSLLAKYSPSTHFINISSAAVYGNPISNPIDETCKTQPLSPYGFHKLMADQICQEYATLFGIKVSVLRVFSAFGPGLRKQLFWDTHCKFGQTQQIQAFGTGNESRDFIFIDDLVQALDKIVKFQIEMFGLFNVGSGKAITISEAIATFAKVYGWNGEILFDKSSLTGYPDNWQADISKIQSLGFQPQFTLEEGLIKYAEWLKKSQSV